MKKVVAFLGSPRKNGNTATLVKEVIHGAPISITCLNILSMLMLWFSAHLYTFGR
ncbi:MAG: NADPH-dependent reductase [Firmicutes bacterium]|nr:NADPH-dependent reductase [Bacillota bacterium]